MIHRAFYAVSRRVGLRGAGDNHGPRLHDLRHRFATATLVNWYRANQDVERRLPLLSAFLGHVHVADTQWYLSGSPELMHEAMSRLERLWEQLGETRGRLAYMLDSFSWKVTAPLRAVRTHLGQWRLGGGAAH